MNAHEEPQSQGPPTAPPPKTARIPWPGRGGIRLLLAFVLLALLATAWPILSGLFLVAAAGLAAAAVAGALALHRRRLPEVRRQVAPSLALGEWTDVTLTFQAPPGPPLTLEIFDHYPTSAELDGLPKVFKLEGGETLIDRYRLRPRRRGVVHFGHVEIWIRSRGDVLRRRAFIGAPERVRVLPNFRPVLLRGLAGVEQRLAQLGVHLQRRRGDGQDFKDLRDYRAGDSMRSVDWKATARRGKLISRNYQDERNQQLILLIDRGRRMHAREGDLTHFDHVLDACLFLAWVAGRQGDAVGFQTFPGDERRLAPVPGGQALGRLLETIYDLETTPESPDYQSAAARLLEGQRRRALVLLLTNLRDEDAGEIVRAVQSLSRRHLVLVASIRERALRSMAQHPITGFDEALEVAAARLYLDHRRGAHEAVRAAGAFVLDVEPQELPASLVHRYLEIKRAGSL
ncbi:MAG: DUF58 domain-containing protein [Acidobacteriota bacterium]